MRNKKRREFLSIFLISMLFLKKKCNKQRVKRREEKHIQAQQINDF